MENRKAQIDEITSKIPEAISNFMKAEAYQEFLKTMGKFNSRSINNCILIAMQRPDATYCEGFAAWKNKFERNVNKGAKGIKIIQPSPYKKKIMTDKVDSSGNPILDKNGKVIQEEVEKIIPAYKVGYVFAYEDTNGVPLPEICHKLDATIENYDRFLEGLKTISPVPIIFQKIKGGANGYFHLEAKDIHIKDDLPQLQTIKTLIHEIAHSLMHDKDIGTDKDTTKHEREVEAESVAYTVASYYGFDTSDYSFGYIAGWSQGKELLEMTERLEMIRSTSHDIISKLDEFFLQQEINEQVALIFKNGTELLKIAKESEGWSCTLYNVNLLPVKEVHIKDAAMKMDAAINHFCNELNIKHDNLMPVNMEHMQPILEKADKKEAIRKLEETLMTKEISHSRHI